MEKPVAAWQTVLVSFRVRSDTPLTAVPVKFGYRDGSRLDYTDTISTDRDWRYKLLVFLVDYPAMHERAFSIDLTGKLAGGGWFEIAELNIVPLSAISQFGKSAKVRVGKVKGVVDPVFGVLEGYGAYFQNLYATRNVNIAGTLTAGDEKGFSSTFYVGKIHKNVILNSVEPEFLEPQPSLSDAAPPAGVGKVWAVGATTKMKVQSAGWRSEHTGEQYCFSIWVKSVRTATVSLYQDEHRFKDLTAELADGWRRIHGSFRVQDSSASPMVIRIDCSAPGVLVSSPQLEAGATPSQYQPTDGTLAYVEDYGAWFSKGGIGGTIQNPLLRLNGDGSISSRDGSLVINPDGTGHFASGRFTWNRDTITLRDFTIRWEDLSENARENLKGEPGADGRDGIDGKDGAPGPAGKDGADGKDGESGAAGKDGTDGRNGRDGSDGKDGRPGTPGKDGEPGVAGKDGVDGKDGAPGPAGKDGTDGRNGVDANLLDWVAEWDTGKTLIDGNKVISPKIFAGIRNASGTVTGVALGQFSLLTRNDSGQFQSEAISGIYGFRDGYRTFAIDITGSVQIGHGDSSILYNAATGKIEFGAEVAMRWKGATYIDKDGIFTGSLSADTIDAIRLNASQITTGMLSADRIDVTTLKAQLITAGNIEALTLNVVRGKIGGFGIDADSIYRGTKSNTAGAFTSATGSVTIGSNGIRGYKWRLDSSGAGAIAGGNIVWDASGNVTFADSVALQWSVPIDGLRRRIDDTIAPRLTRIDSNGIYTGTLTADQINVTGLNASNITTGTLNVARLAAGSITADKVNVTSLQAELITAGAVEGLTLNFTKGVIGGWSIGADGISSGDVGVLGATAIQIRTTSSGSGHFYIGTYKPAGVALTWMYGRNAGHIVMGQVAERSYAVKTGYYGIQMMDYRDQEYFCLAANTTASTVTIYNRIAGWAFDHQQISKGNVCLGSDGSIYNGTKWRLNNDGSGQVANGNISWNASGVVAFSTEVSLNWTHGIDAINNALGGANYPKLTCISSTGIYTGTLTAQQVNVSGLDASNITTGTLAADRIAAGSITADKLNVGSLQATLVTASHIEGLSLDFSKGKIGGWTIGADNISSGNVGVSGVTAIQIRQASAGSGYWYSGSYKPAGIALTWMYGSNAGHIVMGQVAANAYTVKTGYYGIQMMDYQGREYFCLAAHTSTTSVTPYNRIAGWTFDHQQIYKGNVFLSADGSIYNGSRWTFNNDGSGQIANGNISWNAAGTVTFASSVSMSWATPINNITSALGGAAFPKMTWIGSTGIYTGTVRASQIAVDSTLVVGGSSYNGSISVRDASNSAMATLNRTGITAIAGKIGGWTLTASSLYSGGVYIESAGNIYNGSYWRLASDGSGLLASGRISWTATGALTVRNVVLQDAVVKGTLRSPFVRVDGSIQIILGGGSSAEVDRPDSEKYDNMCVVAGSDSGGWNLQPPRLPWNVDQSGRRLVLTHYRYNNEYSYGACTFTAPSGYHFYEYGRQSTTLTMSRETIELIGYGSSTQFYGWIVLNRRDLMTTSKYGAYGQYLAMGTVTGTSSSCSLRYKTYDGAAVSVSRSGKGLYTVYLPWSLGSDKYMVMLTGKWGTVDNTPIYATVKSQYAGYFQVQTSDDPTANDGSFNFIVVSTADFR
jgi:hypothetical protein